MILILNWREVTPMTAPKGLGARGRRLWKEITDLHDLDPAQTITLEEVCRTADRLDKLDDKLNGREDAWAHLIARVDLSDEDTRVIELRVDSALSEARQQQNILKQLLAALRLPDEATGKRPQRRGPRGAYEPSAAKSGNVSSLDRARAAKTGA